MGTETKSCLQRPCCGTQKSQVLRKCSYCIYSRHSPDQLRLLTSHTLSVVSLAMMYFVKATYYLHFPFGVVTTKNGKHRGYETAVDSGREHRLTKITIMFHKSWKCAHRMYPRRVASKLPQPNCSFCVIEGEQRKNASFF